MDPQTTPRTDLTLAAEKQLLAELFRLATEREHAELQRTAGFDERGREAVKDFRESQQSITREFRTNKETAEREYDTIRRRATAEYETQTTGAQQSLEKLSRRVADQVATAQQKVDKDHETESWETNAIFDSTKDGPKQRLEQTETNAQAFIEQFASLRQQAQAYATLCGQSRAIAAAEVGDSESIDTEQTSRLSDVEAADPTSRLNAAIEQATQQLVELQSRTVPMLFHGGRMLGIYLVIFLLLLVPVLVIFQLDQPVLLGVAAGLGLMICIVVRISLRGKALGIVTQALRQIAAAQRDGTAAASQVVATVRSQCEMEYKRLLVRRDRDLTSMETKRARMLVTLTERSTAELAKLEAEVQRILRDSTTRRDTLIADAEAKYPPMLEQIQLTYRSSLEETQQRFDQSKTDNEHRLAQDWLELSERWQTGIQHFAARVYSTNLAGEQLFPAWESPNWSNWQPPTVAPPALRFGQLAIEMEQIPGGRSREGELNAGIPDSFSLPALLDFPRAASLLLQAAGAGRDAAMATIRNCMLRLLMANPPGKVRFTIIDPIGLGENFAGFMHLADYDDVMITNRIWTEPQHIEQRLADLTEQMENIIQKYLRNEFETIEEYNVHAGEVAEAFRILVVANFPAGFTESAARRLTSIVSSGARCGVYTLLLVDANQPMPPGIDLNDLAPYCTCLIWKDDRFVWRDPDLRPFALTVDRPPDDERFTELVRLAGENAKDSRRVEVPFDYIAPREDQYWTGSTDRGLDVPLGRAGATKLQHLRLGQGTSQHVLIAGKTGSGKSSLLHALVTNLALTYSPDQIELYLIDFKKGVEFKTYATHELPHARVIAIESEREFGLSVLQKLDLELRERGDRFRALGVQDLGSYRSADGQSVLPRILLVIDEFHELFVEDDKIAQDASLLLDRLVRQGRAFGIHVLLGSQTLGGAYSLARSTIGQMGVRIALQCSESDAHLILSEDNTAARLLSRPGEAIYNDAGGLLEGNNPFQVVWLSDERREEYLDRIRELAAARPSARSVTRIVFEGNAPADLRRNLLLAKLLVPRRTVLDNSNEVAAIGNGQQLAQTGRHAPIAWLGEAVAIKDPTSIAFKRENGTNLLIVGQREETALAILAAALVGIAAQTSLAGSSDTVSNISAVSKIAGADIARAARFYILESPRGEENHGNTLASLADVVPHSIQVAGRRDVPEVLDQLAAEVERRQTTDDGHGANSQGSDASDTDLYLFVHDVARFRDLRRDENDLGFSFSSEPKKLSPDKQFAIILRDGPAVGIHTLCWCDSLANLNRAIDRTTLREFDLRVLFQMSPNDSSYLIDSPLASKLGQQLAIFQNEDAGVLEKFRPYKWPDAEWLQSLGRSWSSNDAGQERPLPTVP